MFWRQTSHTYIHALNLTYFPIHLILWSNFINIINSPNYILSIIIKSIHTYMVTNSTKYQLILAQVVVGSLLTISNAYPIKLTNPKVPYMCTRVPTISKAFIRTCKYILYNQGICSNYFRHLQCSSASFCACPSSCF